MTCRWVILGCLVLGIGSWTTCYGSEHCSKSEPARRSGPQTDAPQAAASDSPWELIFDEDFDDAWQSRWQLDGIAELKANIVDGNRVLAIHTQRDPDIAANRQSVLWCKRRFRGNLRIAFRIQAETGNRSIFYFNARPTRPSKDQTIFDWQRPDAQMEHYAGDERLEMYSVGILRDDESSCNLRYIGGSAAEAFQMRRQRSEAWFGEETIIRSYPSPYRGKPDTWFDVDVQNIGKRLRV
jgi:hypothetical protein